VRARDPPRSPEIEEADDDQLSAWRTHQCRWWWCHIFSWFYVSHFKQSFYRKSFSVNLEWKNSILTRIATNRSESHWFGENRHQEFLKYFGGVLNLSIDLLQIFFAPKLCKIWRFFLNWTASVQLIFDYTSLTKTSFLKFIQTNKSNQNRNKNLISSLGVRAHIFLWRLAIWRSLTIFFTSSISGDLGGSRARTWARSSETFDWIIFCQKQTLVDGEIVGDRQWSFSLLQDFSSSSSDDCRQLIAGAHLSEIFWNWILI